MTKLNNYLVSMTELKTMGFASRSTPDDSNKIVKKSEFATHYYYDKNSARLMNIYTNDRCPRYQDFEDVKVIFSLSKAYQGTPTYNTDFYFVITLVGVSVLSSSIGDVVITDTLPNGLTLRNFGYVYRGGQVLPNPVSTYYSVDVFQSNVNGGSLQITIKDNIWGAGIVNGNTITIGFTAKSTTYGSFTNTAVSTYAQTPASAYILNGSSTVTITTTCNPTANWVNNGSIFCSECRQYQPQIDNNPCSSTYNQTRNVDLGLADACGTWNLSYYCSGCDYYSKETNSCTGNVRNVTLIQSNSPSCGGCCGQSTSPTWTPISWYCGAGGCNYIEVQRDTNPCSPTYNQTRDFDAGPSNSCGTWNYSEYCLGCDKYSHEVNTCTNQERNVTLIQSNSTYCGGCCGQSTSPIWTNTGSAYCGQGEDCNQYQEQTQTNICCNDPAYGSTQTVNLGPNSACGIWVTEYYCVGYDYYSKEVNSCTGAIRNVTLVQVNSPSCGYVPPAPTCRIYNIIAGSSSGASGTYEGCASGSVTPFSFSGGPGIVGQVCARIGTVSVTGGTSNNTGTSCT